MLVGCAEAADLAARWNRARFAQLQMAAQLTPQCWTRHRLHQHAQFLLAATCAAAYCKLQTMPWLPTSNCSRAELNYPPQSWSFAIFWEVQSCPGTSCGPLHCAGAHLTGLAAAPSLPVVMSSNITSESCRQERGESNTEQGLAATSWPCSSACRSKLVLSGVHLSAHRMQSVISPILSRLPYLLSQQQTAAPQTSVQLASTKQSHLRRLSNLGPMRQAIGLRVGQSCLQLAAWHLFTGWRGTVR